MKSVNDAPAHSPPEPHSTPGEPGRPGRWDFLSVAMLGAALFSGALIYADWPRAVIGARAASFGAADKAAMFQPVDFTTVAAVANLLLVIWFGLALRRRKAEVKLLQDASANASQIQEQLAAALDGISIAVALFDPRDRLVVCNRAFRKTYPTIADILTPGLSFEQMLRLNVTRSRYDLGGESIESYVQRRMARHREAGEPFERALSDGRWERVHEDLLEDGSRMLVITDISQLKRQEFELARIAEEAGALARKAEEASRVKSEFLANMSHEFRTPLNAILGFAEVVDKKLYGPLGSDKYENYVADILANARHLFEIISDVLEMSRIEAGAAVLQEDRCEVAEIVGAVERMIAERAENRGVSIRRVDDAAATTIFADKRALKQAVLNLASNAVKFTPKGGQVTITTSLEPSGDLCIAIADTGIGIAAADIPKILQPFRQLDNALSRKTGGIGLGLSIAKALTDLHQGELLIDSQPGVGTTVTLRLPASRVILPADTKSSLRA
jgi:two-component system, cell cycle sensor histidine kinase PleC